MSIFAEKIKKGIIPSESDWENHLIEAHANEPRMTPEAFATFANDDGQNSYAVLASHLPPNAGNVRVVDLGCGDGHLIPYLLPHLGQQASVTAVDISRESLALAANQISDSRVTFLECRAQELPLPDATQDFVFCHMALMLMTPITPVIQEIHRVLKPGGTFVSVISGGQRIGLFQEIQRLTALYVQAHLPQFVEARKGSVALNDHFWSDIQVREIQLRYHVTPEGVLEYLKSMYFMPLFPDSVRRELHGDLLALARENIDESGRVLFYVPLKCLSVSR